MRKMRLTLKFLATSTLKFAPVNLSMNFMNFWCTNDILIIDFLKTLLFPEIFGFY